MKFDEQYYIDFFSYEKEVFHNTESIHIRQLLNKIGISLKDLIADEQFQILSNKILENKIRISINPSDEFEKLIESLKFKKSNLESLIQLNEYLIFYMKFVPLLIDKITPQNNLMLGELDSIRKNLPVYNKPKSEFENLLTFKKTQKLNLIKLSQFLKIENEDNFYLLKTEIGEKYFKPFLKYNQKIYFAFENKKINDEKIDFLGSLFELKYLIELLIENKMIYVSGDTKTLISKIFLVKGKVIKPEQLIKPNGSTNRFKLIEYIIQKSKK